MQTRAAIESKNAPQRPAYVSVDGAAAYTGLSTSFLNRLRVDGRGARFVKAGARVLYAIADLDKWLSAQKRSSTSDPGEEAS